MTAATRALATWAAGLTHDDVPPEVVAKVCALVLDFTGVALAGAEVPEAVTVRELVLARTERGPAGVLATARTTSTVDAAYCNGAAADVLEHQDGYRFGGFHPSHVLPALVAVAEEQDLGVRDLVTAAAAAYEVANRIGRVLHPAATAAGWFPVAAGFGAAAGCARLRGLDADGVASSIGAAGFFVPVVMIEAIFTAGTVKPAFAGQLARAGVEAAEHAAAGLTGWDEVLEHPRGLVRLLGGDQDDPALTAGLGTEWTVLEVHQKRWAGCRHTHGATEACVQLAAEHDLRPEDVAALHVETYEIAKVLVDRPVTAEPTAIACTLSLPYTAAVALVDRELGGDQFGADRRADPRVHRLASLVTLDVAPDLQARYPDETATRVRLTTTDGRVLERLVEHPAGDRRAPVDRAGLLAKFEGYAVPRVGRAAADRVVHRLDPANPHGRVRDLVRDLQPTPSTEEPT